MLPDILVSTLVCPRCQGSLAGDQELRCTACGTSYPIRGGIPRMSDGVEQHNERMAAEWQAQAHAHALYIDPTFVMNHWEKQMLPHLFEWVGEVQGTILDVGCGVGMLGAVLAALGRSDVSLLGTDFQGTLLDEARTGYAARVEADVHQLPFRDGSFAAAIASNSLHHFPDAHQAMVEIARVLQPGGVLVACDPRYLTPLEKLKKLLRRNDEAFTKDHKAFRVDEYRQLLGSSGLSVTDVRTVNPLGPLLATGLDYLKVGRLGFAPAIAKALAATDRLFAGSAGQTLFGLMLAGRAVKRASATA